MSHAENPKWTEDPARADIGRKGVERRIKAAAKGTCVRRPGHGCEGQVGQAALGFPQRVFRSGMKTSLDERVFVDRNLRDCLKTPPATPAMSILVVGRLRALSKRSR
jgi:hypothetical protein